MNISIFKSMKKASKIFFDNSIFYSLISVIFGIFLAITLKSGSITVSNGERIEFLFFHAKILELLGIKSTFSVIVIFITSIIFILLLLLIIGFFVVYTTNYFLGKKNSFKLNYLFLRLNFTKYVKAMVVFAFVWIVSYILIFLIGFSLDELLKYLEALDILKSDNFGLLVVGVFYIFAFAFLFLKTCSTYIFMFLKSNHEDMFFDSFKISRKEFWNLFVWLILLFGSWFLINRFAIFLITNEYIGKIYVELLYFYILGLLISFFLVTQIVFTIKLKDKFFTKEEWNFIDIDFVIEE